MLPPSHGYHLSEDDIKANGYSLKAVCNKYGWDESRFTGWEFEPFEYSRASWLTSLTTDCFHFRDAPRRYCATTGKPLSMVCAECGTCSSYYWRKL